MKALGDFFIDRRATFDNVKAEIKGKRTPPLLSPLQPPLDHTQT